MLTSHAFIAANHDLPPPRLLLRHADHDELLGWFGRVQGQKKRAFLLHGEPERSSALKAALDVKHIEGSVEVAVMGQLVEL